MPTGRPQLPPASRLPLPPRRHPWRWPFALAFALLVVLARPALAGQLTIYEENDTFGFDTPSDRHYTQGLRFEYSWKREKPRLFARLPFYRSQAEMTMAEAVAIAQNMYTPEVITSVIYDPNDRPFAGWLYVAWKSVLTGQFNDWQDTYEIDLGVVGPSAHADEVQSWFHDLIGDPEDPTYVNQIPDSPVLMASFIRRWAQWGTFTEHKTWPIYVMPSAAVRLGNVMTDVGLGLTALWGFHAPADFSAGVINPSFAGDEDPGRFRFYAHAAVEGRAVAFNAFLDGTAGRTSASIDRNALVTDYKVGFTVSWKRLRLSHTQVWRSPEISSRANLQNFGAFQLGYGRAY